MQDIFGFPINLPEDWKDISQPGHNDHLKQVVQNRNIYNSFPQTRLERTLKQSIAPRK